MTTLSDAVRIARASFHRLVLLHLHMRGIEPDQGELLQWLACLWPHVEEDMDPARWAGEYIAARAERIVL